MQTILFDKKRLIYMIESIKNKKIKNLLLKAIENESIDLNIMNKLIKLDYLKINDTLINIASEDIFKFYPNLFDIITTQSNEYSQQELFKALNSNLITNKKCIQDMLFYTDQPIIQKRIRLYEEIDNIKNNELIYMSMLNINSNEMEEKMRKYFLNKKIIDEESYLIFLKKEQKKYIKKVKEKNYGR